MSMYVCIYTYIYIYIYSSLRGVRPAPIHFAPAADLCPVSTCRRAFHLVAAGTFTCTWCDARGVDAWMGIPVALGISVRARRHAGTQARRHAGTQARRHAGTQAHRHAATQPRRCAATQARSHAGEH